MMPGLTEAPGIGRLLSENNFTVPNHQRDYSWTEDEVREFIDDITSALDAQSSVYFVGLMVFLGVDSNLTVLDGQQRLATAIIIFSAIRNWLIQYDEFRSDADDIQRDFIGRRKLGGTTIEPKLVMNVANQQTFIDYVIHSRPIEDVETEAGKLKARDKNKLLLDVCLFARRWVAKKAEEFPDQVAASRYFFNLVDYMRENVGAVKLIVPNEEMAYTIFETLNDRGLELSPLDLVKSHVFGRAAAHSFSRVRMMETRWAQMIQTLANVRSDQFLKVFWTSRHGRIRTRNLFDTFKKQYPDTDAANNLSIDMLGAAEQYAALEVADDPTWAPHLPATRQHVRAFKIIGSQLAHPVILAALSRFDPAQMERLLRLLEVCVVRYLHVGGGNTGRLETTCAVLAPKIYAGEVSTATQALAELNSVYPGDAEFKQAFIIKEEENNQKA
ncbi:MAG TPA: DUF262 domain-containing protein, partial [Stellaceae bacterium]|nr:DUF262 domain-containing protein [Stellaceae bacterium]